MTTGHRNTPGLIHAILDALERHGYYRSDDLHADRAIGLIGDLACIYEGTQDHPAPAYPVTVPPSRPAYPGPSSHDAITLTRADASTVVAAPGHRRRLQARPRRDVRRLPRPVLPHLRDAPPGRPRPTTRWPAACSGPPKPPRASARPEPDRQSQPAADREAGQ